MCLKVSSHLLPPQGDRAESACSRAQSSEPPEGAGGGAGGAEEEEHSTEPAVSV